MTKFIFVGQSLRPLPGMTTSLPPFVRPLEASLWDVGLIGGRRQRRQRRDEEGEAAEIIFGKLVVSQASCSPRTLHSGSPSFP
jgi:hypothetical protein